MLLAGMAAIFAVAREGEGCEEMRSREDQGEWFVGLQSGPAEANLQKVSLRTEEARINQDGERCDGGGPTEDRTERESGVGRELRDGVEAPKGNFFGLLLARPGTGATVVVWWVSTVSGPHLFLPPKRETQ
jgi:hypothetical protein